MQGVGNNNAKALYELSIAICLMFYPSFLLGVFSVVDFCSKDSRKILYRQPSLLLLPTFTCFTFSRISSGCRGQADNRVTFSKKMTGVNMVLTVIQTICWELFYYHYNYSNPYDEGKFNWTILMLITGLRKFDWTILMLITGLVSTLMFLFYDKMFSGFCGCCLSPSTEFAIYQPETRSQRAASTSRDAPLDSPLDSSGDEAMPHGHAHAHADVNCTNFIETESEDSNTPLSQFHVLSECYSTECPNMSPDPNPNSYPQPDPVPELGSELPEATDEDSNEEYAEYSYQEAAQLLASHVKKEDPDLGDVDERKKSA